MATSSIFDAVKIRNSTDAEAFVRAAEESVKLSKLIPQSHVTSRMASNDDLVRLAAMRQKQRDAQRWN